LRILDAVIPMGMSVFEKDIYLYNSILDPENSHRAINLDQNYVYFVDVSKLW
jgi:hypothetical protein